MLVVKVQSACFETLTLSYHVFNVRKTKRVDKVDGLGRQRWEDVNKENCGTRNSFEKFWGFWEIGVRCAFAPLLATYVQNPA